jgi:hypothetical protein
MVHSVCLLRIAAADVNVNDAPAAPELAAATVNVVDPHPLATTDANVPHTKVGRTKTTVSPIDKSAFNAKDNDTEVA